MHSVHSKSYGLHRAQLTSHKEHLNRHCAAALALSVMLACCQEACSEIPAVTTSFLQSAIYPAATEATLLSTEATLLCIVLGNSNCDEAHLVMHCAFFACICVMVYMEVCVHPQGCVSNYVLTFSSMSVNR